MVKIVVVMIIKNLGKGENTGYQHFLFYPTLFSEGLLFKVVQTQDFAYYINLVCPDKT